MAAPGIGCLHGVLALGLEDRQATPNGPQRRRVRHAEQGTERLLRPVVPHPHHRQQKLVRGLKVKVIAPADGAPATGAFEALKASRGEGGEQVREHLLVPGERDPRQRLENSRVGPQVFAP
jgi:hypothetical protein